MQDHNACMVERQWRGVTSNAPAAAGQRIWELCEQVSLAGTGPPQRPLGECIGLHPHLAVSARVRGITTCLRVPPVRSRFSTHT